MVGRNAFIGNVVSAQYDSDVLPIYRHNAYVEALPPVLSAVEAAIRIKR